MKKIMLAAVAVFGLTLANAQTTNTSITTGADSKVSNRPTVEVRAERSAMNLKSMLSLNEDQYKKMYDAKLVVFTKLHDINMNYRGAEKAAEHKTQMTAVHTEFIKSIKGILTTEQYTTWEKTSNERYERWKTAINSQPSAPKPDMDEQKMRMEME